MNSTRNSNPWAAAGLALTVLAVATVALLALNFERHSSASGATLGAAIAVTVAALGPRSCRPRRWRAVVRDDRQ